MNQHILELSDNSKIPIIIKKRRGLRNITLRPKINPIPEIHISMPYFSSVSSAIAFVETKREWIEKVFARAPEKIKIVSGDKVNFLGRTVVVKHDSNYRSNFYVPDSDKCILIIGGGTEMFESRLRELIKKEFLTHIREIIKTVPDEFRPTRITIRDTTSRWGSCSSTGTISFSWRIALAPYDVMRYVIMHEFAHRKYMDHSPDFWAQVAQLYGCGVGRAKLWLAKNGHELHRYF